MVQMRVAYQGQKHCELVHGPSGSVIETDAPKDNHGKGENFSPTDLIGASLASCALTTMAIVCEREAIPFEKATATVGKIMTQSPPRKIESLVLQFSLPASLTTEQRAKMELTAKNCPVHLSLHPDLKIPMEFRYL